MKVVILFWLLVFVAAALSASVPISSELTVPQLRENISTLIERTDKIVGGMFTTIKAHPYQVSFHRSPADICGGSIISRNRILTAAHCTDGIPLHGLFVRVGSESYNEGGKVHEVSSVVQHPQYNRTTFENDISVIKLLLPIVFTQTTQAVKLPNTTTPEIPEGKRAIVTGWGKFYSGNILSPTLLKVDVPRISRVQCIAAYLPSVITTNMICFGFPFGKRDACEGDQGGPLVRDGMQYGIYIKGSCGKPRLPGIYTEVKNYQQFIENALL